MSHPLLISARDSAAAFHLIEVVKEAKADGRFQPYVFAQEPAYSYMTREGIDATLVPLAKARTADSPEAVALLDYAHESLRRIRPRAVLCGLSTPFDGGIDEAILARSNVTSFLMQDFWGEQNSFFGRGADHFLVLDEEAVRLSWTRHRAPTTIVGSPRHSAFADINIDERRRAVRQRLDVDGKTSVLGFFGQALHRLSGYRKTVEAWAQALAGFPGKYRPLYKPHPRESEGDQQQTKEIFRQAGLDYICLPDCKVEDALLACDVACSAFSNCTYDVAYLNYFSPKPLITPVSLFFDPEVIEYFHRIVRLEEWPYLKSRLVMPVRDGSLLRQALLQAALPDVKEQFWRAARQHLIAPGDSAGRALNVIDSIVGSP